ncbi:glutaredoxin family protein [Gottfriedia acidiceleris]|uniref:Glutaredoxin family protein n=1 Tax=Gottfriedia acidiceleris TaxID=371036 RepID=A0ABY4JRT4_9BACI|nr:glutaredoxin family protein [Gottfriedia acidiceleris]UPM56561.1 glutaredoxin family protein [Gottfriedia acidiceleris]
MKLTLFTKENCGLCEEAKDAIRLVQSEYEIEVNEVDIYSDDALLEEYQLMIPVIQIDGETVAYGKIHKIDILNAING